jgi:hypothetical protein
MLLHKQPQKTSVAGERARHDSFDLPPNLRGDTYNPEVEDQFIPQRLCEKGEGSVGDEMDEGCELARSRLHLP